jgi:trk system potassium uptake protein TrkH
LILFGINFSLYFLILIGKIKKAFKSEELKTYFGIIITAIIIIMVSLIKEKLTYVEQITDVNFEEIFRASLFQVASIITTTGFSSVNYDKWPEVAKAVIVILMICGAMAGSTGGGIKVSRLVIAFKGIKLKIKKLINPKYVAKTKYEEKSLDDGTINDVFSFFTMYFVIIIVVTLILSFDQAATATYVVDGKMLTADFTTNLTAAISCMSNIGPGLNLVGPYSSFNFYNYGSKIVLTITMLIGRLEILPVLLLFSPRTWKRQ